MPLSNKATQLDDETMPFVTQSAQIHPETASGGTVSGIETLSPQISVLKTFSSPEGFATPVRSTVRKSHKTSHGRRRGLSSRMNPKRTGSFGSTVHGNRNLNKSCPAENELDVSTSPITFPTFDFTSDGKVTPQDITVDNKRNRPITNNNYTSTNIRGHPYARSESGQPDSSSDVSFLPLRPADNSSLPSHTDSSSKSCPSSSEELIQIPRALDIFVKKPKHPELAAYEERLGTFSQWPKDHHIKPEDLARAGLYFAGEADRARCFSCGGGLRNWHVEDDPCVEHARWFSKCSFICQYMGQDFMDDVKTH